MSKSDAELGRRVNEHLLSIGMETPMQFSSLTSDRQTRDEKVKRITNAMFEIMSALELDLNDDSLMDTPNRVAKMYVDEFFSGLDYNNFPKCTTITNKMDAGMVIEKHTKIMSNCEHHFVTIDGFCTIAYLPKSKVLGLSKLNRVANFFARRPQVQERLTNQIWHALSYILETDDLAVYIDAVHYCVKSRGVEDQNSSTVTSKLGGQFMSDPAVRAEFMSLARG